MLARAVHPDIRQALMHMTRLTDEDEASRSDIPTFFLGPGEEVTRMVENHEGVGLDVLDPPHPTQNS